MKSVAYPLGTQETPFDNLGHIARHIQCYFSYYFSLMSRVMFRYQLNDIVFHNYYKDGIILT